MQPQVLDLPRGRRTRAPEPPSPRPASRCPRKRVSSGLAAGRLRPSGVTLPPVTFHLQGRRVAFVCCCHPNSAPLLPGPAGPGPVADADPAVPVRQLPAAPAGEQLRVHPHPAGRPLGHKDTVSFTLGVAPRVPLLVWGWGPRPRFLAPSFSTLKRALHPPASGPCLNWAAAPRC